MDPINFLPEEILIKIFGYLSSKMIKSCSLVCKRWDEIIGNSCELMGRFELDLKTPQNDIEEAKTLKRRHQAAFITGISADSLDVISRHKLRSLKLYRSESITLSSLIKALNSLPSLKVFDANYVNLLCNEYIPYTDDVSGSINFKKVQIDLEDLRCAVEIIHIFGCSTIKILKIDWASLINDDKKMLTVDFLKRQKNLEEFALFGSLSSQFFNMYETIDLKLTFKKFRFCYRNKPFWYHQEFVDFLELHKETLISLELCFFTETSFGIELIHKFALENILHLKHLEMGYFNSYNDRESDTYEDSDSDSFDSGEDFEFIGDLSFDELPSATQVTKNIESLALRTLSTDMNENKRFLAMFSNLKHLNFRGARNENKQLLKCVNEITHKVETVKFQSGAFLHLNYFYFPRLKEFCGNYYYYDGNLLAFINRHSKTLEKIILKRVNRITNLAAKEILKCPNLKYLELHLDNITKFNPKAYKSVMKMFDEVSSKTNPFTLCLQMIWLSSTKTFILPDDKAFWDEEIGTIEEEN